MAGSYRHILGRNGEFTMQNIENRYPDAYEALEECFDIIQYLTGGDRRKLHEAWLEGHIVKRQGRDHVSAVHSFESYWKDDSHLYEADDHAPD